MHDVDQWRHDHDYAAAGESQAERRTLWVILLAGATMVLEIVAGTLTGSMALLADGWHMATHVGALSIAALAYYLARRYRSDPRFTFGTGKIGVLGGYTSAVVLGLVALLMAAESVRRLLDPQPVRFEEAMLVAWIGLAVNLLSAWLLSGAHHHGHGHSHHHGHDHHDDHDHGAGHGHDRHGPVRVQDHNLRAAYLHVLADALTSVLAIVALFAGSRFGWTWMDPLMGIVGAIVIGRWSLGLLRDTGRVLLDAENPDQIAHRVRATIESLPETAVADLHLWRVGPASHACIVSLVTHRPLDTAEYKARLAGIAGLDHVTVEVNRCREQTCTALRTAEMGA